MFTGIIQSIGTVVGIEHHGDDMMLEINADQLHLQGINPGDSVAINGVCLTVVKKSDANIWFDVSVETLALTNLSACESRQTVNLELAMCPTDRFGGHIVSGHVDGIGELLQRCPEGRSVRFDFRAPHPLMRYIAGKGSITIDGVSLTVNHVADDEFGVNIVPYTLDKTLFGRYSVGQKVHLEVDIIARYLERLIEGNSDSNLKGSSITQDMLESNGFIKKD